jgi:hypothetical protein
MDKAHDGAWKITVMSNAKQDSAIYGTTPSDATNSPPVTPLPVNFSDTWKISIPRLILHTGDQYIFRTKVGSSPYWTITGSSAISTTPNDSHTFTLPIKPLTFYSMSNGNWGQRITLTDKTGVPSGAVVLIHSAATYSSTVQTESKKDILVNGVGFPAVTIQTGNTVAFVYDQQKDEWTEGTNLSVPPRKN